MADIRREVVNTAQLEEVLLVEDTAFISTQRERGIGNLKTGMIPAAQAAKLVIHLTPDGSFRVLKGGQFFRVNMIR